MPVAITSTEAPPCPLNEWAFAFLQFCSNWFVVRPWSAASGLLFWEQKIEQPLGKQKVGQILGQVCTEHLLCAGNVLGTGLVAENKQTGPLHLLTISAAESTKVCT